LRGRKSRAIRYRLGVVDLTDLTKQHVRALFADSEVVAAERWLSEECADNLPGVANPTPEVLERLRFAALRFSGGRLDRLAEGIAQAKKDWRDLLMASGFAHNTRDHLRWQPRRFEPEMADRWRQGDLPAGVVFGPNAAVQLRFGLKRGYRGILVELAGVEPEARYRLALEGGEVIDAYQRALIAEP
jgi:hypothetical protein